MNVSSSDGILRFEFDEDLLRTIEDALGSMKSESRRVLKNAVNDTARDAKKDLAKKAQETYAVKQGRFTKAMKTQNATESSLTATINVTGEQLELKDFKVSPATYRTGQDKPDVLKAKVLLSSSLKGLMKSNNKAFLVKFRNGHVSVAQRYHKTRYPHEFSGGQRQRIGIARAIALQPDLIVCDEPVSALDVSVQSQVLNLLKDLQKQYGLTYLFIGHDLSVINFIADRVCVMFLGHVCEVATKEELYSRPMHPYTAFLMDAIPQADPHRRNQHRRVLMGEVPSPVNLPSGCCFHTRCPYATERCRTEVPELREWDGRMVACHRAGENWD